MRDMIEKINKVLRYQRNFKWQDIHNYNGYKDSFEYHVEHHPINEKYTGKWNSIINYENKKTISYSYYNVSTDLAKKFSLIPTGKYDVQYIKQHESVNIVNNSNGLIVCLKFNRNEIDFNIATCFFPSRINKLLSIGTKFFSDISREKTEVNSMVLNYMMYKDNTSEKNKIYEFKKAMREFFGADSLEYNILFNNVTNNVKNTIDNIVAETEAYLNLMEGLIKNEDDREYYFIFSDGIEYIAKLSLLYKIKDKNYEKLYNEFLNIDINNSYKNALDECQKYIDEGEIIYGNDN